MTEPTKESRNQAFDEANPTQVRLYSQSGQELTNICIKYDITDDDRRKKFSLTVGDVILGFYKQTELPQLLQENLGIETSKSVSITSDLLDFLSPLSEANNEIVYRPENEASTLVNEEESENNTSITHHETESYDDQPTSPLVTDQSTPGQTQHSDQEYHHIKSVPTTESDENSENESVYTSTQSALLHESRDQNEPSLKADGVNGNDEDDHRWDRQV